METEGDLRRLRRLKRALSATVSAGLLSAVLVMVWVIHYREGLAWDGGLAEFNWHPVLNLTGFIFLQGMAIIVYRYPWTWKWNKLWVKIIHAGLHSSAFVFAVIAFVAVFDFHNNAGIPNMYSLHSWLGMVALVLYSLQIVLGIGLYLLPIAPVSLKAAFMPLHVYSGLFIFSSTIATALMGITEKLIFGLKDPKYKDSPPEATFVNLLGLVMVVFGALVFWIVTQSHWKRPSDQVFRSLQTEASTIVRPALSQHPGGLDTGACDDFRRRGIKQEAVDLQD